MRWRSAITAGSPSARSTATQRPGSPVRNALRARSTRSATAVGSGATDSVPESMRPASSRSATSPRMCAACSKMMRWNSRISAGSSASDSSSSATAEPVIDVSGVRSSWLTSARNSVRRRSVSSSGARSCMVTTTEPVSGASPGIGVALTSVRTLRPSGTESTTSSERTVSGSANCRASGNSASDTSRPSARRQTTISSRSSSEPPGARRLSTMRRASRLYDAAPPLPPSNTTTPTGEVSTSASRSCRARRSPRCARALPIAAAACAANSTSTSSSASVNAAPPAFSPRNR